MFSTARVATRLQVSGGELKKRCVASHAARSPPASTAASTAALEFVEGPAAPVWPLPPSAIASERQRPDGARLRMHAPEPPLPLTALVRAFVETPACSS